MEANFECSHRSVPQLLLPPTNSWNIGFNFNLRTSKMIHDSFPNESRQKRSQHTSFHTRLFSQLYTWSCLVQPFSGCETWSSSYSACRPPWGCKTCALNIHLDEPGNQLHCRQRLRKWVPCVNAAYLKHQCGYIYILSFVLYVLQ